MPYRPRLSMILWNQKWYWLVYHEKARKLNFNSWFQHWYWFPAVKDLSYKAKFFLICYLNKKVHKKSPSKISKNYLVKGQKSLLLKGLKGLLKVQKLLLKNPKKYKKVLWSIKFFDEKRTRLLPPEKFDLSRLSRKSNA